MPPGPVGYGTPMDTSTPYHDAAAIRRGARFDGHVNMEGIVGRLEYSDDEEEEGSDGRVYVH